MSDGTKTRLTIIISVIIIIVLYWWGVSTSPPPQDTMIQEQLKNIDKKLDSLNNKKDSIRTVIITVDKEIIKNTERHEKVVNNIINNSDSINRIWTNDYIKRYIDRIRNN